MKTILIFGDSNTFGYISSVGSRYDKTVRWSGILQTLCADKFKIIEDGCNNRTAFCDNPAGMVQTGLKYLPTLLNDELDGIVLAVGINDLQVQYGTTLEKFKNGLERLVKLVQTNAPRAKILLTAPAQITDGIFNDKIFSVLFDKSSIEKSKHLSKIYETVATEQNCHFLDWNNFIKVSEKDGLHLEPQEHKIIAQKTFELLNKIF